ncbi:MAG: hypothetical protein KDA81_10505 [Planctomycetaceae bacterium]|nr:hypothetical protein [Planctomycetaceae bacterium]
MRRFILTAVLLASAVVVSASSASAGMHFGRMAFVHHQSPSTWHAVHHRR